MASLANQTISSTYDGLIKTSTDQPVPISGVQLLEDGVGNSLALSVGRANQGVTVTGTLTATSISGVLADGVTATTQTLGDNSTKVATTAYVDAQVTASDLDFAGDSGTGAVDLDSQTFTIAGTANEIETVASGQTVTIGLPNNVNVAGNLTVDTNTLYVDAANNRVGIGTTTLTRTFNVNSEGVQVGSLFESTSATSTQINIKNANSTNGGFIKTTGDNIILTANSTGATHLVVADGGNVGIGTSSPAVEVEIASAAPQIRLTDTDGGYCEVTNVSGNLLLQADKGNTEASSYMRFDVDGSEKMRIDSSGNVGIGATNPSDKLVVIGDVASTGSLKITGNSSTPSAGAFVHRPASNTLALGTASTERMRISSTGNVGIGTSSPAAFIGNGTALHLYNATTSPEIRVQRGNGSDLAIVSTSTAGGSVIRTTTASPLILGSNNVERMRIDSSGNVLFKNGATTYGSISNTDGTDLQIGSGNCYIRFDDATNEWLPTNAAGTKRDNVISLGASDARIKNIYTSGSVYLGDTAAANALDDYEEGTFTSSLSNVTATTNSVSGRYTKIGNVVSVHARIQISGKTGGSGNVSFNLPFAPNNVSTFEFGLYAYLNGVAANHNWIAPYNGTSTAYFYGTDGLAITGGEIANGNTYINGTYRTS